jgi:hexosaminidase
MPFRFLFLVVLSGFLLLLSRASNCQSNARLALIPEPVAYTLHAGRFQWSAQSELWYPADQPDWALAANFWTGSTAAATGYTAHLKTFSTKSVGFQQNSIVLQPDPAIRHAEGYKLEVSTKGVIVRAQTAVGAFYGLQTLRQLFPPALFAPRLQTGTPWTAPACVVEDAPRFEYRGLHLDVGRHWFPVAFIKRYIDLLAAHKMNRFHWHLTEDQGWRIEIKKYPKLQSVAACRSGTLIGHFSDLPHRYDGQAYCHYYTQAEVREVVEYARQRFVTIVPEIEMPGHALAALTAYPELGCTGKSYSTARGWGVFDDVYCAGNEKVFTFLNDVLTEVCALFPGEYVHIGGDECPKTKWETCPKCQKRMQQEGMGEEYGLLQRYFVQRAAAMLAQHGKRLIGWDEILEGGLLVPDATVMSWRGTEGSIAAAQQGHDVIMTPTSHCYFDYYQGNPDLQPLAIGGYLPLEQVYGYEPVPEVLNAEQARHILGAQGNVWTEYLSEPNAVERMAYPRACALAEVVWSPRAKRNWPDFTRRLRTHFQRLDAANVPYSTAFYEVKAQFSAGELRLTAPNIPELPIVYTTDGSLPTPQSPRYTGPLELTRSSDIRCAVLDGQRLIQAGAFRFAVHQGSGRPYQLSKTPAKYKGTTPYALTDGLLGDLKSWTQWVGIIGTLDPVIDLGQARTIQQVRVQCLADHNAHIRLPRKIELWVSPDGVNFQQKSSELVQEAEKSPRIEQFTLKAPNTKCRFVKLVLSPYGTIPAGQPGAGSSAWLFADEVVVE